MNFISKGNLVLTEKNLLFRAQEIQECFPNENLKGKMKIGTFSPNQSLLKSLPPPYFRT
jgi:hypothetical protein